MDIEGVFAIGAIFIGLPWVIPVSYTHLDVYKRQRHINRFKIAFSIANPQSPESTAGVYELRSKNSVKPRNYSRWCLRIVWRSWS